MTHARAPEPPAAPPRSVNGDWVRALQRTARITPSDTRTLYDVVHDIAAVRPEAPALVGLSETLTYRDLVDRAAAASAWARHEGLGPGDTIALVMDNSPRFVAIWLGLSRLGVVVALINTQLVGEALTHCLALAAPRRVIVDVAHRAAVADGGHAAIDEGDLPALGTDASDEPPPVTLATTALLIYTSGTTGLPKAARVSHYRIMMWAEWFAGLLDAQPSDRLYNCLPMYHSVGGVVAVGAMLVAGGAVIVRTGFSARGFWPDVAASGATIFQYIGELCRYLLNADAGGPPPPHALRIACGNGLRGEVWTPFQTRFAIPRILEFYAATEGSFSLFNVEGRPGAIGRIPRFMAHRTPVALVRMDADALSPVRGPDGFCQRCDVDEAGEAIGRLAAGAEGLAARFEGYTNKADSDAKILRDVFAPGDAWFRTGDLMRRDAEGFFVFVDRLGDTFRWKGENVATSEVAQYLSTCPGVFEAVVYGVSVPFADGRAGMVALHVAPEFSLETFAAHSAAHLPPYARPLFLRRVADLETTGTFKTRKASLLADGFDPARCGTVHRLRGGTYVPLDAETFAAIMAGTIRL